METVSGCCPTSLSRVPCDRNMEVLRCPGWSHSGLNCQKVTGRSCGLTCTPWQAAVGVLPRRAQRCIQEVSQACVRALTGSRPRPSMGCFQKLGKKEELGTLGDGRGVSQCCAQEPGFLLGLGQGAPVVTSQGCSTRQRACSLPQERGGERRTGNQTCFWSFNFYLGHIVELTCKTNLWGVWGALLWLCTGWAKP